MNQPNRFIVGVLLGVGLCGCERSPSAPKPQISSEQQREHEAKVKRAEQMMLKRQRAEKPTTSRVVNVSIRHTEAELYVTNLGSDTLERVEIYINGKPPFTYGGAVGPLHPRQEIHIQLKEFTKRDGLRFNPYAYKLTEIWIGGNGYDYAQFNP